MAHNLGTLDARVLQRLGTASSDTRLTSTLRYQAINDALQELCLEHDWPWLLTSANVSFTAGTTSLSLPLSYVRTKSLVETSSGVELTQVPLIVIDQIVGSGRPTVYNVDGEEIAIRPTADTSYTYLHRYFRAEATLTGTSDAPLLPLLYSRGVVELAASFLAKEIRETDRALEAERDYGIWLKRAQDNIRQSREPVRIRVRRGAWL